MSLVYHKRETIYEDDTFEMSLEEAQGEVYVHLAFFQVTKASIKSAREEWEVIKDSAYWLGYEYIYSYTTDMRVVKLFNGWEHVGEVDNNGIKYEVVRWALN